MIKTNDKEKDVLLSLIRATLKGEELNIDTEFDIERLLKLAVKQQVYTIVLPLLTDSNLLDKDNQQKWNDYRMSEIQKNLIINSEREALVQDFEEAGIRYMFTKGLVIKKYYPQELMRQMSDNDIFYGAEKREALFEVMKNNGYYMAGTQSASDDFFKAPYVSMEMHKTLFSDECEVKLDLDLWKKAIKNPDYDYRYDIAPEDNYIYSLAHMYKHYSSSGCGIRFLCDTFLLRYSDDLDFDYINTMFEKFDLTEFHSKVLHLVDCIFNDEIPTADDKTLLAEVFAGSVFGVGKSLKQQLNEQSKLKYLWRKIFPTKEFMHRNYEILDKKPYLLFHYYIKHFIYRYKNKGDKAKKTLKNVLHS